MELPRRRLPVADEGYFVPPSATCSSEPERRERETLPPRGHPGFLPSTGFQCGLRPFCQSVCRRGFVLNWAVLRFLVKVAARTPSTKGRL